MIQECYNDYNRFKDKNHDEENLAVSLWLQYKQNDTDDVDVY